MKVPIYIESDNGHDTKLVPEDKVAEEVTKQVQDGKWATVEKLDVTTEIVTEDDLDEEDKALQSSWKDSFQTTKATQTTKPSATLAKKVEKVTSVTCTAKAKGG